jgi:broad specificity phosphatase PhoE
MTLPTRRPALGRAMILLVRHGQTEANGRGRFIGRYDVALDATGREQARALAAQLRGCGIARLYTSPLRRAVETTEIIAAAVGLRPIADRRLAETNVGSWQGRSRGDAKAADPALYRALRREPDRFRFPGGESLGDHQRRVRAALSEILRGAGPALVVCHSGTIRCALALGRPEGLSAWREFKVPHASLIALPEASVAALDPARASAVRDRRDDPPDRAGHRQTS